MELTSLSGLLPSAELQDGLYILQQIQMKNDPKDFSKLLNLVRRCPHPSVLIPLFDRILHIFEEHNHLLGFAIIQFAQHISFLLPRLAGVTPPSLLKHITRCFEKCHPESWMLTLKLLEVTLPITENCDLIHHYVLLAFHESTSVMLRAYRFCYLLLLHSKSFPSFFATWAESSISSFTSLFKQKRILILLGCIRAPLALSRGLYHVCLEWLRHSPTSIVSSDISKLTPSPTPLRLVQSPTVNKIYIQATALRLLAASPELSETEIQWVLNLLHHSTSSLVIFSVYRFLIRFPHIASFQQVDLLLKGFQHPHVMVKRSVRQCLLSWIQHSVPFPFDALQPYFTDAPVTKESFVLISACLVHSPQSRIRDPRPWIQWFLNHLVMEAAVEKNEHGVKGNEMQQAPCREAFKLIIDFAKAFPKYAPLLQAFLMSRFCDLFELVSTSTSTTTMTATNAHFASSALPASASSFTIYSSKHHQVLKKQLLDYAHVFTRISKYLPSLPRLKDTLFAFLVIPSTQTEALLKNFLLAEYPTFCRSILLAWVQHSSSLDVHLSSLHQLDIESHYLMARHFLKWPKSPWVRIATDIFAQLSKKTFSTYHFLYLEHWMYLAQGISGELSLVDAWQSAWVRMEACPFPFQTHLLQLDLLFLEATWTSVYFWELSQLYAFLLRCSPYLKHEKVLHQRIVACQCIAKGLGHSFSFSEKTLKEHQHVIQPFNLILNNQNWTWEQLDQPVLSIIKQLPRDYFRAHVPWFVELFILPNPTNVPHVIPPDVDLAFQTYGHLQTAGKSFGIQYGELGVLVCNRPLTKLFRELPKRKTLMELVFELNEDSDTFQSFRSAIQADYIRVHPVSLSNDAFNQSIVIPSDYFALNQVRYVVIILQIKLPNGQWWATNTVSTLAVQVFNN